ncbi:MAG: UDP-N-acetylmuramate dehydrogenase [Kiritimatiellaeota bacterium]|nr:UDP-N-acetylmuramate dehydrogenase [Kiritimatiellota bacterium]
MMLEKDWLDHASRGGETPRPSAHFMGVCGVGMAGVAALLAARGWRVTGCDASESNSDMRAWLEKQGVIFLGGHDAAHARGVDVFVHTSAVAENHPELAAAKTSGARVARRGEVLAEMVAASRGVAVCGTHGKTTTSCWTVQLLQSLRLPVAWCVGGHTPGMGNVANKKHETGDMKDEKQQMFIVEADESDGTLAVYAPEVAVITNIDDDHLEHFKSRAELEACFGACVAKTHGGVAYNADDPRARRVARRHACHGVKKIGFGRSGFASLRAENEEPAENGTAFDVVWRGDVVCRARIGAPGGHNVMNALAALAAVVAAGGDLDEGARCLDGLRELPARRFECVAESWRGARVVVDYAHHPREIAALVAMARTCHKGRVLTVFEPHRFSRTKALLKDFPAAFDGVDALALLPVYAASEAPVAGGGTLDLYGELRKQRPQLRVALAHDRGAALAWLKGGAAQGDLVLIVGAGPVGEMAGIIKKENIEQGTRNTEQGIQNLDSLMFQHPDAVCVEHGKLDNWTTFRTPATARWRIEVRSFEAAREALRWAQKNNVRTRWFGSGANTLASDIEFDGAAVRFAGNRGFLRDGATVVAGCGWKSGAFMERLTAEGFSGLEFMEGIPGQLGGWLAMNAGAHGHCVGERVAWVRALRPDGSLCLLHAEELAFEYRAAPGLRGLVAAEVGLRMDEKTPSEILAARKAFRAKRMRLAGLRCAGSVFKNPPGDFAGRLIEAAGCKGKRIGGARVYRGHANVIALDKDATASDVVALVAWVRECVREKFSVTLETEIVLAGGAWE